MQNMNITKIIFVEHHYSSFMLSFGHVVSDFHENNLQNLVGSHQINQNS